MGARVRLCRASTNFSLYRGRVVIRFKPLIFLLLLFSIAGYVNSDSHGEQISSTIRLKILPDKVGEFEGLVAQLVRDVHANEPGAKVYEVRRVKGQ